jgi:hypothetical protein
VAPPADTASRAPRLTRCGEGEGVGLQDFRPTDEDHSVDQAPGHLLIESGEQIAGSMARSAAGLLFDPASSRMRLDPALATCLRRVAEDAAGLDQAFCHEQVRVGAALAFAVELAVTRTAQGRTVRTDGFLPTGQDRSAADEVAEAAILAARTSAEEGRVRHFGYLVAEAAVSPDLDAGVVLRGLRFAAPLTGRQLAFLAAVGRRERIPLPMAPPLPEDPRGWREWGALEDVADLQHRGLLDPPPAQPRPGGAPLPRLRAADLRLTRRGVLVHRLLELDLLHENAVTAALTDLGLPRT